MEFGAKIHVLICTNKGFPAGPYNESTINTVINTVLLTVWFFQICLHIFRQVSQPVWKCNHGSLLVNWTWGGAERNSALVRFNKRLLWSSSYRLSFYHKRFCLITCSSCSCQRLQARSPLVSFSHKYFPFRAFAGGHETSSSWLWSLSGGGLAALEKTDHTAEAAKVTYEASV